MTCPDTFGAPFTMEHGLTDVETPVGSRDVEKYTSSASPSNQAIFIDLADC